MGAFQEMAPYYEKLFPVSSAKIHFIETHIPRGSCLDAGCATGELGVYLTSRNYDYTGIDRVKAMIKLGQYEHPDLNLIQADMRNLKKTFKETQFDSILCLGNTLPLAGSMNDIKKTLASMDSVLKPNGTLFLQFLNFDLILRQRPDELGDIRIPELVLKRRYRYRKNKIYFSPVLIKDEKEYFDEAEMYPITVKECIKALEELTYTINYIGDNISQENIKETFSLNILAQKAGN